MEKKESKDINTSDMGLTMQTKRKPSILEIKQKLGLDKILVIRQPIPIKKDGKHLYQVAGFFYPLRPETIERLNIPNQRIICEVDRNQWIKEMMDAKKEQEEMQDEDLYSWENEE